MFGGSGKGGFVRTRISPMERSLSWLILGLVAATGGSIYLSGQTYDESLFGLDPASLASASPARTPVNTIVVAPTYAAQASTSQLPAPAAAEALAGLSLPGWRVLGGVEQFTQTNLYEKINGRAEQYISYEVVGLSCLGLASGDDRFLDVYVYDMGTPERAFGIYSVERDPEAAPVDMGRRGYISGASLFLWHGNYYVQVLASAADEALRDATQRLTEDLLAALVDAGSAVPGLQALPAAGMIANSEKFYAKNALGFGFLTQTYSAEYQMDDRRVTLFLSVQPDAAGADAVLAGYRAYLNDFSADITESRGPADTGEALFGDMDGYFDVVLRQGTRVAGAALLEDRDLALRVASQLLPGMVAGDQSRIDDTTQRQ
jgi:hypothetical protein